MKKKIFFLIAIGFGTLYAQTKTTNGCKDSIFNVGQTEFICKQVLLGDWQLDSVSGGIGTSVDVVLLDNHHWVWTFYPSGDLYTNHKGEKGENVLITSNATFYKGNMILQNIVVGNIRVVNPEKYNIVRISPDRLELVLVYGDKPEKRYILRKIK